METLQEERDAVRHYLGGDARWQEEPPAHVHETAIGALNDADRLARLEDGIRALAVKFDRAAVAYRKEGLNGQAELWDLAADRTRALLDGE